MTDKSHFFINEILTKNLKTDQKILERDNHLMVQKERQAPSEANKSII